MDRKQRGGRKQSGKSAGKSSSPPISRLFARAPYRREVSGLVSRFGDNLEKFLKDGANLDLIAKLLTSPEGAESESGPGISAEEFAAKLRDSDPFGIPGASWQATLCCLLYQIFESFRENSVLSAALYGRVGGYKHIIDVHDQVGYLKGTQFGLKAVEGIPEFDRDFCFNIEPTGPPLVHYLLQEPAVRNALPATLWKKLVFNAPFKYQNRLHCEITPCDRPRLENFIRDVNAAQLALSQGKLVQVKISGTLTMDETHQGDPGHLEIHPVRAGVVL